MSRAVRIDDETYERLVELGDAEQQTLGSLIAKAVALLAERRFWEELSAASRVDALRESEADLSEKRVWDNTITDGLENDPYPLDGLIGDEE